MFSVGQKTPELKLPVQVYSDRSSKLICLDKGCLKSNNRVAADLYNSVNLVYRFFSSYFNLSGIDGNGSLPRFHIDWGKNNAAWTCSKYSCFWKFNNDYIIPSVVCHEYTHAIIHRFTGLAGTRESGALHESLADVMAIAFKRFHKNIYGSENWSLLNRNMRKHRDTNDYRNEPVCDDTNDRCHVHDNSKIPSHAFYSATKLSGNFDIIAHIWFEAMINMGSDESFQDFAERTVDLASTPKVKSAVRNAWQHVGMHV